LSDRIEFVLEPEPYAVWEYSELVKIFRDGRIEEAANAMAMVPRGSLRGAAKEYRKRSSDNAHLKAAALLHTEAAITATKEVVFHLNEAREYLNRINDIHVRTSYLRQWFIAVSYFFRSSPRGWGALSIVNEALKLYSNDFEIQLAVGSVYESAGRRCIEGMLDRAEGLYREVLANRPENVEAHMRLGRVLQLKKDWAGATRELKWSLEHAEDHAARFVILMLLGDVYYQLGDLPNTVRSYRGALEIDPGCQVAAVALSHALHRSGEWAGSREIMSRFLDREESSSNRPDEWKRYLSGRVDQLDSVLQEMREEVLR
jgi:tetratricopeptide (TPR) repeat protein